MNLIEKFFNYLGFKNNKQKPIHTKNTQTKLRANIGIDVSDKVADFRKYMETNYNEICKYPEFDLIKEEDKISLLNSIWDKWSLVGDKPIKQIAAQYPQYEYSNLEIIYAIESGRVTDYCHMQTAHNDLQKRGWADFVEYYIADESFEDKSKGEIRKDWIRLVKIEDMVKCSNIYIKPNGKYCHYIFKYIMGTINGTRYLKNVYLYSNGEYIKMTPKEFKQYCKENDLIYPLWLPPKEAKEAGAKMLATMKANFEKEKLNKTQ